MSMGEKVLASKKRTGPCRQISLCMRSLCVPRTCCREQGSGLSDSWLGEAMAMILSDGFYCIKERESLEPFTEKPIFCHHRQFLATLFRNKAFII